MVFFSFKGSTKTLQKTTKKNSFLTELNVSQSVFHLIKHVQEREKQQKITKYDIIFRSLANLLDFEVLLVMFLPITNMIFFVAFARHKNKHELLPSRKNSLIIVIRPLTSIQPRTPLRFEDMNPR